jgi:hypothetical protein
MKTLFLGVSLASLAFVTNIAFADGWPASVLGTWSVTANHTSGTLRITTQDSTGDCRFISGEIFGNPMHGFYCPQSGRIHFLRKNSNGATIQDYTGNLSQVLAGSPLLMAGTWASDGGSFGEYNWSASASNSTN